MSDSVRWLLGMAGHLDITALLHQVRAGDKGAEDQLFSLLYEKLRGMARWFIRQERPGHTLQPTALISEMYLRVMGSPGQDWIDRAHFFRICAVAMRRILVDHARSRNTQKRGGLNPLPDYFFSEISEDDLDLVLMLDMALEDLAKRDTRQAKIVEMRFFAGLTEEEISLIFGVSSRTVKRDWVVAKAWLKAELQSQSACLRV